MICATVLESTTSAVLARMAEAAPRADLIEVRADAVAPGELDVATVLARRARPVIFTCRAAREGGLYRGSEADRLRLLREASERGAEWIDVEWDAELELDPARVVVSRHDFEAKLDTAAALASLRGRRAAVQKLARTVTDSRDALALLALAARESRPTIAIGMGPAGVASRLLAERSGAPWTYAAAGGEAAPGQLPLDVFARLRTRRRVTRSTKALGVLGKPVAHSRSPALMNSVFGALGVDAVYTWLETEDPAAILAATKDDAGWLGFSVTIPHKETVARVCDRLGPSARATGAVNTVVKSGGEWVGHNTDAPAVAAVLARAAELRGARVDLLGAGGAARAAAWALREAGAHVTLYDRTEARGAKVAAELGATFGGPLASARATGAERILVNATSVGMAPEVSASPVGEEAFDERTLAFDMVYVPEETRFLDLARRRGARTVPGLEMFVSQARAQLEHWLGKHIAVRVSDEWLAGRVREGAPLCG